MILWSAKKQERNFIEANLLVIKNKDDDCWYKNTCTFMDKGHF